MAFSVWYDCSNILEIVILILVLGSVALSILLMFKTELKQKVGRADVEHNDSKYRGMF